MREASIGMANFGDAKMKGVKLNTEISDARGLDPAQLSVAERSGQALIPTYINYEEMDRAAAEAGKKVGGPSMQVPMPA